MTMSKASQRAYLGEGLALGLLALGHDGFMGQKMTVELSFNHAWDDWTHARRFPQVHADIARTDLLSILHESPGSGAAGAWSAGSALGPS